MAVIYNQRVSPQTAVPTDTVPKKLAESLGSGLALPLVLINNQFAIRNGVSKVQQDIFVTLGTPIGSRLYNPSFGSELPFLIFEEWGPDLQHELVLATFTAINTWVPQVIVDNVTIDPSNIANNFLVLVILYHLKGTLAQDAITINLAIGDSVELPPDVFTIDGRKIFQV